MFPDRFPGLKILLKGASASEQPVRLSQRRIFLLPTKLGLLFALLVLGTLVGALNYGNNLAYAAAFLLAATAMVSVIHTYRNLAGIIIQAGGASGVFAGQEAHFQLIITEDQRRWRRSILLRETGKAVQTDLSPAQRTVLTVPVPTWKRGTRHLGQVKVSSSYPLGLTQAWSWIRPDMSCIVYPRPVLMQRGPLYGDPSNTNDRGSNGDRLGAEDFKGLQEHAPGDSYKRIDWKALARGRGLMVKCFEAEEVSAVWFDLQALEDLETETALSVLAGLILEAEAAGLIYGLRLPGQSFPPDLGSRHKKACLRGLALYQEPSLE